MQKEELEFIDVAEEPKKTEKKRRRAISQKEADLCHAAAYCGIVRSSLCPDQDTWDRCVECKKTGIFREKMHIGC